MLAEGWYNLCVGVGLCLYCEFCFFPLSVIDITSNLRAGSTSGDCKMPCVHAFHKSQSKADDIKRQDRGLELEPVRKARFQAELYQKRLSGKVEDRD